MSAVDVLAVIAVVESGGRELLVLNRPLHFVYEQVGNDYIGKDGPFMDVLRYERARSMKAFAGRELSLSMADGSSHTIKDHWWQSHIDGTASVAHGDIESLKKCYVFSGGACIALDDLAALRSTYTGCVYPYLDYQKVIQFDDMRKDLWRRIFREERRCRAVISEAKRKHRELVAVRTGAAP